MPEATESPNITCAQCGESFYCGVAAGAQTCWCFNLAHIVPDDTLSGCLCPKCLRERIREQQNQRRKTP